MRRIGHFRFRQVAVTPEFNVALFAFLLHFPWEFLQVPLFAAMPEMAHWDAVKFCTRATLGDVAIALTAFWLVAGWRRERAWLLRPDPRAVALFVAVGLVITLGLEWHATELQGRWQYAEHMPRLPWLGTGLAPLLQWLVLPLLLLFLVRRQVVGARRLAAGEPPCDGT
ncbi:hypothetical protein [Halomonas faecis]|uniref:hypothetical protein n=1 Tax=Halomonas faecis TaxID=1562110 RepID=UPI0013D7F94E|nr:hypothetical protein [Halomonas faecis]